MVEYKINNNDLERCTVTEVDTVADIPEGVTSIGDGAFICCKSYDSWF